MHILTKEEYDEAVQSATDRVFDPLGDTGPAQFALEVVDLVNDDRQDDALDRITDRVTDHARLVSTFETNIGRPHVPPVLAGSIVEHADENTIDSRFRDFDPSPRVADSALEDYARAAFHTDVFNEVTSRAKACVENEHEAAPPEA